MAESVSPSEIIQELRHQLKENKQELRSLNGKLLISEATAYSLANQLHKYECGKHKYVIESVLGEKLQHKEGKLPERLMLAKKLRESNIKIQEQAWEISHLRKKLQEGKEISSLINNFVKVLIIQKGSDCPKGHHLQDPLAEVCRLVECLVSKLSPENNEDEDNEKDQETLAPRQNKEELEEEEELKETLQDSLDEGHKTSCSHYELLDIHQPPCSSADPLESEDKQKQEEEEAEMDASMELKEDEEMDEVLMDSLDEMYLVHSSFCDFSDSHQPPKNPASLSEEHMIYSTLDITNCHENNEDYEEKTPFCEMYEQDSDINFLLEIQARDLANLKLKVQEGRDASLDIKRHLEDLLTHPDPDCHHVQGLQEHLAEGFRLAEHLADKLSPGDQDEQHKEEKETPESLANRNYYFLVQVQARGLTHLRQQLKEGSEAAFSLIHHLTSLLSHEACDNHQHQGLREQLSESCRLTEGLLHRLSHEYDDDDENDEEELESLDSSELQDKKENELLPDEWYYVPSGHPDSFDSQEGLRSTVLPSDEPRVSPTGSISTQEACARGPLSGTVSPNMPEVQASHVYVESRAQRKTCLGTQLGPHVDYGNGEVRLSLFYTNYSFAVNTDSAQQWMHFQEMSLDACFEKKIPPKLEYNALEGSAANKLGSPVPGLIDSKTVLRQKIRKRKLWLSKWKIACRFPGLQASEAKN